MQFIAATTFTLKSRSHTDRFRHRVREFIVQPRSATLRQLVVSASPAPSAPARKSSPATATGFLRTRFVDLKRAALDIQPVEFSNGLCSIISRPEFDESKTA